MKKAIATAVFLFILTFSLCSMLSGDDLAAVAENGAKGESVKNPSKAETLLASMTLQEKIGQLFIIRPEALKPQLTAEQINATAKYGAQQVDDEMKVMLKKYPAGGIVLFAKNISEPQQLTSFLAELQQQSEIPLFIGVDEEGGSVARVANSSGFQVTQFDSMEAVGQTGDAENAKTVGIKIGSYLKEYGFNLDFAPVADVNTNPDNRVIGNRSFGSDPTLVADMVEAEISGLREAGIMSCVKHFPGHGDTRGDTHKGFVAIDKNWDELLGCELIPFQRAIAAGTDMVMISHITASNITYNMLPSSLCPVMVEEKLRGELGFQGVVITDSLAMGAITQEYEARECAVAAVSAGVDILLMPEEYAAAFDGLWNAVEDGRLPIERVDQSVLRILKLKEQYGLLH